MDRSKSQAEALARVMGIGLNEAAQLVGRAFTSGDRLSVTYDGETYTRTVEHVSDPDEDGAVTLTFEKPL